MGTIGRESVRESGREVGEKTGEKVGESLGEIDKLNLCRYLLVAGSSILKGIGSRIYSICFMLMGQ